ncbi:hypothetical protein XENTR_v10014807 [Xenopus tropicalis]|uniref:Thiamine transporter 2 n=1 Tax=Xenopus tropicalis TaxID=8364 RepID=Q28C92_XENTR|nr:solute carrier family 19 member 3 gene 2 [Xenopus tropicalis]KAE8604724.1 hypothetical protein XENTR_v10014807 [Xenopus tropicalis]CAJ82499.1 Novel solute carrier family 19 protein [Xenopus tropicalis]|eukprot:NP_001039201.1 solute carrier family 19 (thiamine transporter), member 2 [Xenopus tropicalis]
MAVCGKEYTSGWKYPTILLCLFGFFADMRAVDPFTAQYFTGSYHNLTVEQVKNSVLPVWTYSYIALLIPVFLLTDYLRYKPIIVLQALGLSISMLLMLITRGEAAMQGMEFAYAIFSSCDVAYYSYIYSMVDIVYYQRVTSYCRSITLVAATLGALLQQILMSFAGVSYFYLNILTLTSALVSLVCSMFLPVPSRSMFFHKKMPGDTILSKQARSPKMETTEDTNMLKGCEAERASNTNFFNVIWLLCKEVKECYWSRKILYWSLWWAFATPIYNLLVNYSQLLWVYVEPSGKINAYNSAVDAASTFLGAILSMGAGFVKVDCELFGEAALTCLSIIDAGVLLFMGFSRTVWISYAGYLIFKSSYMLLITIATFNIAVNLSMERYALLFGFNTLVALFIQTLLTVVVDHRRLGLDLITQFLVYGSYFSVVAVMFMLWTTYLLMSHYCKSPGSDLHSTITAMSQGYGLNSPTAGSGASHKVSDEPSVGQ